MADVHIINNVWVANVDTHEEVVLANKSITLQPEDFHEFLVAIDTISKPIPALQKAFKRHAEQVLK
jgi:uncharacterized protein (DUF1778 family)